jgi:hypothetical protein
MQEVVLFVLFQSYSKMEEVEIISCFEVVLFVLFQSYSKMEEVEIISCFSYFSFFEACVPFFKLDYVPYGSNHTRPMENYPHLGKKFTVICYAIAEIVETTGEIFSRLQEGSSYL